MKINEKAQALILLHGQKAIEVVEELVEASRALFDDTICNDRNYDNFRRMTKYKVCKDRN